MKWDWARLFKLFLCWLHSHAIKVFGVLIWLWFLQLLSSTGRWSLRNGALDSRFSLTSAPKKKEKWRDMVGAKITHSMSVLLLINSSFKTTLLLGERNGTIWFLMKLKTSRTLSLKDGKLYLDLILKEDFYLQAPLYRMMSWSSGPSCIS